MVAGAFVSLRPEVERGSSGANSGLLFPMYLTSLFYSYDDLSISNPSWGVRDVIKPLRFLFGFEQIPSSHRRLLIGFVG